MKIETLWPTSSFSNCSTQLSIQSFFKNVLLIYYVSVTAQDTGDKAMNKIPALYTI